MRRTLLAIAVLVAAVGFTPANRLDISGSYTSNWGSVVLHQSHGRVTGEYDYQHGHIDGVLDGNVLRYAWHENDGDGRGVFVIATDGELVGTWGIGDDDTRGGGWRLAPTAAAAIAR